MEVVKIVWRLVHCIRYSKWVFQKFKINRREETQVQIYKYTLLCIFLCLAMLGVGDMGVGGGSICCTVGARSFLSDRFSWTLAMFQCGNAGTMNFVVWRKSTIRGPKVTCCVEESMQMPLWYPYIAGWCAGGWYEESDMRRVIWHRQLVLTAQNIGNSGKYTVSSPCNRL